MKIPRDTSGEDLANLLCGKWDYRVVHQEGSHIVLETGTPSHQRIAVPAHKNLRNWDTERDTALRSAPQGRGAA